jgi:hypothetical protein
MVNHPNRSKRDPARSLVKTARGALATVYYCPFCEYRESFKHGGQHARIWMLQTGREWNARGYGLAMGGSLHSKVAAHIRASHADQLQ